MAGRDCGLRIEDRRKAQGERLKVQEEEYVGGLRLEVWGNKSEEGNEWCL